MVKDDKYSDKEFDSKHEMYLHWGENYRDELNSHDMDKVKKAERKEREEEQAKMQWRKKMAIRGSLGLGAVVLAYFLAPSIAGLLTGGAEIDEDVMYEELNLDERPVLGDRDAEITIVEFADYMCPACRSFEETVKPELTEYFESGDAKLHYVHFPLPQFSPSNYQAATAAECIAEQDQEQYWNFHDALYQNQGNLDYSTAGMINLADDSTEGIDTDQLEDCIQSEDTRERVNQDRNFGNNNGVSSTPTVFVNGDLITNWNNLPAVIEERLE